MTAETKYEVYDKRTGDAITYYHDGSPCRLEFLTTAEVFRILATDSDDPLSHAIRCTLDVPAGAVIDVRPVKVEVGS